MAATKSDRRPALRDLAQLHGGFRRQLLVQLGIILELVGHGAHHGFDFGAFGRSIIQRTHRGHHMAFLIRQREQRRALLAFHEHAHIAIRQLEHLHDAGDHAHVVKRVAIGIVLARVKLRDQKDVLVARHRLLKRGHALVAPHEQRHDHLREDNDVPQRQEGQFKIHDNSKSCAGVHNRGPLT
ncbi:hypothetical protein HNP60_001334 [Sphingobium sp. B1D3A]|uniref:Uncharacterized protein n=1 Tax=Sphingobium lignivorans TaxID=2735886 RepID=A0ABR6NDK2_9SPHN|nr:hypothetical protein [Sphingobium lignivorans]